MNKAKHDQVAPRFVLDAILASGSSLWGAVRARHGRDRLLMLAAVAVLLASPWSTSNFILAAVMLVLVVRDPGFGTALAPFAAPFAYQPKVFFGPRFPVIELLVLGALLGSGLRLCSYAWTNRRAGVGSAVFLDAWDSARGALSRTPGLQAALLGLLALASLLTIADPNHLRESVRELRTVLLEPIVYLFLALYWLRRSDLRAVAVVAFVAGATVIAAIAVVQFVSGANVVLADGSRRVTAVYQHPNNLALYLGRAFAFGIGVLASVARPARNRLLLGALVVIGAGLILSVSLGSFLGVGAAVLVVAFVARGSTTRVALLGGLGLAALAVLLFARGRIGALLAGGGSYGLRRAIWDSAIAMLRDHPAFGVGLDQFLYQYAPRYVQPAAWAERFTAHAHNLLLDFWLRLGLLGLAWVGWTVLALISQLATTLRTAPEESRPILMGVSAALITALVHGLVDNFFFLIDLAYIWWLLVALAYTSTTFTGQGAPTAQPPRARYGKERR